MKNVSTAYVITLIKDLLSCGPGYTHVIREDTDEFFIRNGIRLKFDKKYNPQKIMKEIKKWLEVDGRIINKK